MDNTLQVIRETDELSGPLRSEHLESTKQLVKMLGPTAELMKGLGSTPIAGPILLLLGLVLETVHRERADIENLQFSKSELQDIKKRTFKAIKKAIKKGFDEYKLELLDSFSYIEQIAKQLETYELKSTLVRFGNSVRNLRTGPTAILDMIQECKTHLRNLVIYHIEEVMENVTESENGKCSI